MISEGEWEVTTFVLYVCPDLAARRLVRYARSNVEYIGLVALLA